MNMKKIMKMNMKMNMEMNMINILFVKIKILFVNN